MVRKLVVVALDYYFNIDSVSASLENFTVVLPALNVTL